MATAICLKPSTYAQRLLHLDGAPFSLAAVPFMIPILDCAAERMILMTARQVGKSTTLSAKMLTKMTAIPHRRGLYVAPRSDQVVQFSKDRLSHMIAYSPMIQNLFIDSTVQQQVKAKEFLNGSMMFLRSCYHTADGARGISANDISIDEIQDIIMDNIPVIEECAARKASRQITYCGTPKTNDNAIQKIWDNSTQNYWAIKCPACNHWNVPLDMANIGPNHLICSKCGGRLSAMDGRYVSKYPKASVTGFHISQCMIYGNPGTGLDWSRIIEKMNDPLYGMAKFINECLGFSYDVGARLITEAELRVCCDHECTELTLDRKSEWGIVNVCAGVDWGVLGGNTHTVVVIGGMCSDGKLRVFFAKKFPVDQDPVAQVDEVCDIINRAGCSIVAADRGGGHVSNAFLRKKLTWAKVHEIEYKARVTAGMQFSTKSMTWVTDRTRAIAGVLIDIKRQQMIFPEFSAMKNFFPDVLTLMCEYNDNLRAYQILREHTTPDDFAHGLVYLRLAAKKILGGGGRKILELEDFQPPVVGGIINPLILNP